MNENDLFLDYVDNTNYYPSENDFSNLHLNHIVDASITVVLSLIAGYHEFLN